MKGENQDIYDCMTLMHDLCLEKLPTVSYSRTDTEIQCHISVVSVS